MLSGLSIALEYDHPLQTEVRTVKPYQLTPGVNHIWRPAVVCLTGIYQGCYLRTMGFKGSSNIRILLGIELVKTEPQQRKNTSQIDSVREYRTSFISEDERAPAIYVRLIAIYSILSLSFSFLHVDTTPAAAHCDEAHCSSCLCWTKSLLRQWAYLPLMASLHRGSWRSCCWFIELWW